MGGGGHDSLGEASLHSSRGQAHDHVCVCRFVLHVRHVNQNSEAHVKKGYTAA